MHKDANSSRYADLDPWWEAVAMCEAEWGVQKLVVGSSVLLLRLRDLKVALLSIDPTPAHSIPILKTDYVERGMLAQQKRTATVVVCYRAEAANVIIFRLHSFAKQN
jgi:hypothetical protein